MYTLLWIVSLLVVGVLAGAGAGALLAFTGGRLVRDLAVGQLGALSAGFALHFASGGATLLPTLVAGFGGAILATWLTRVASWPAEPKMQPLAPDIPLHNPPSLVTTGEASRIWIHEGRLVTADHRR